MAAKAGNNNAAGKHRVADINDKKLAAEVRSLALAEIKAILEQDGLTEMKKQVILKLASTVLPRLNEHSGEGGGEIMLKTIIINKSGSNNQPAAEADGSMGRV